MKHSFITTPLSLRNITLSIMSFTLFLFGSCSKSNDVSAPASPFTGTYTEDNYEFKVESTGGSTFRITNFGGFLNKPLNAQGSGSVLTIPSQTFTNPNGHTLTIVGTASMDTNENNEKIIKIQYSVSGFTDYDGQIIGIKH